MKPLYREGMTLDQQACFDLLCLNIVLVVVFV